MIISPKRSHSKLRTSQKLAKRFSHGHNYDNLLHGAWIPTFSTDGNTSHKYDFTLSSIFKQNRCLLGQSVAGDRTEIITDRFVRSLFDRRLHWVSIPSIFNIWQQDVKLTKITSGKSTNNAAHLESMIQNLTNK